MVSLTNRRSPVQVRVTPFSIFGFPWDAFFFQVNNKPVGDYAKGDINTGECPMHLEPKVQFTNSFSYDIYVYNLTILIIFFFQYHTFSMIVQKYAICLLTDCSLNTREMTNKNIGL